MQLAVATTTVVRNGNLVRTTTRPATSETDDYTVWKEAESPPHHGVAMRFGVSMKEREGTAQ
eukprot:6182169-Pleurochrysis_carterae.AAC.1